MGRKKQPPSTTFSFRIPVTERRRLQEAADASGRSLNAEIRKRIDRSFADEDDVVKKYGDRRNAAFFRLLSIIVRDLKEWPSPTQRPLKPASHWMDDDKSYEQVAWAARALFELMDPKGTPGTHGSTYLANTLAALNNSPQGHPTPEATARLHVGATLDMILMAKADAPWAEYVEVAIREELADLMERLPDGFFSSDALRSMFTNRRTDQ